MDTQTLILILTPLILLQVSLQIAALVDIWRHKGAKSNTLIWVIAVIALQFVGAAAYFLLGRKEADE